MGERIHDVAIVGGGLSGLHTAWELQRGASEVNFLLLEARERLGGRILTETEGREGAPGFGGFDLGPAWFWPGQPRMLELIEDLGLTGEVVDQFADGDELVERARGQVIRGRFGVSMGGSYRLRGGMGQLIGRLAARLPGRAIRLGCRVERVERGEGHLALRVSDGTSFRARRVVLALPPRVALERLELLPAPDAARRRALRAIPTWMASQGKFLALFKAPFWRDAGLSGDAVSMVGPLGEIHDVTPSEDSPGALFGFFALPPAARRVPGEELEQACRAQLQRLFGARSPRPERVFLKDWSGDPLTATAEDLAGPAAHSLLELQEVQEPGWSGRLVWSGSESAGVRERHNGYLEGALEASLRAARILRQPLAAGRGLC
ncbi:MAG: FAD-dependent oxidoreductase [Acidobacteriota bacterium]